MRRFSEIVSILSAFVALPVCCIVEYLAGMKMGMHRYLVLKNAWLMNNVFTLEAVPYIFFGAVIILLAASIFFCRPAKSLRFVYGIFLVLASSCILKAETFFTLRAAPWFGLSILLADAFWVLSLIADIRRIH